MVALEGGMFKYRGYLHNYMGPMKFKIDSSMVGKNIPIGHGTAGNGSYMVNFFNSNSNLNNVALHLLQGELGLIYSRTDNGLLKPKIYKMDEVDFVDFVKEQYALGPTMTTQDQERKYFGRGDSYFKSGNYISAIEWFDKVIGIERGKMKANAHYAKGICFLNLKRMQEGMLEIQKAINIDANLQKEAIKLFPQLKKFFGKKTTH
jgi:tetratricopeptide (TPR) repeat protein